MSAIHFPNESKAYRTARDELLAAEIELSRQTERVAELRRKLPMGGEPKEDYVFESEAGKVKLSELFGDKTTLVLYSYMFGPAMKAPCPMCTSFLDALEAQAHHLGQRVAVAVTARSPLARVLEFTKARGWSRFRVLSDAESTYHRDYFGEDEKGAQQPMLNVWAKQGGKVHHFWGTEMLYAPNVEGQDQRHIDALWPLWNILDLTPEGRGKTWYPSLRYDAK